MMKQKIQREIMKRPSLIGMALLILGCASNHNRELNFGIISTNYPNGKTRTKYFYRDNEISSGLMLFDSNGVVRISQKDAIDFSCANYRSPQICDISKANLKKLSIEMESLVERVHKHLRSEKVLYKRGTSIFYLWIAPDGRVEHAVCKNFRGLSKPMIQSVLNHMESWVFSPGLTSSGSVISQRINFK
jgi:hypothetical protein